MRHRALPWLTLVLLAELAFGLACRLAPAPGSTAASRDGTSISGRFFTASRTGLGAGAVRQADLYLHRGVDHVQKEAFAGTWFQRVEARVAVHGVMHREGEDAREVVPWLWFGTRLDPDNVDYSLDSAYWLKTAGRDDLAMDVVRNALERHPRDPRIHLERARLLLRAGLFGDAARAMDVAWTCANADPRVAENRDEIRRTLRTYRGLLYEYEGNTNAALGMFSLNRERPLGIEDRVSDLRNNRPPHVPAATLLSNLVHVVHRCDHHDNHKGGEDDGDARDKHR